MLPNPTIPMIPPLVRFPIPYHIHSYIIITRARQMWFGGILISYLEGKGEGGLCTPNPLWVHPWLCYIAGIHYSLERCCTA